MNDRPSSDDESSEIAELRRLLADARHTEPMPDDVTARMDRVISRLGDETPAATPEPASVVPIAPHRRRRAAALLVAAAAIVVGGVAVGQLVHPSPSSTGSTAAPETQTYDGANGDQNLSGKQSHPPSSNPAPQLRQGRVVVRPKHFPSDALSGRALLQQKSDWATRFAPLTDCGVAAKRARAVPAEYEHAPAALLFRRPVGDTQVVDLFVCGSSQPIKSTTLPAP